MRVGSKGIPGKSLTCVAGKPLISHTLEQVVGLDFADQIMAPTDSTEIGNFAAASGADFWFLRPAELATDSASKISPGYCECPSASFWVG